MSATSDTQAKSIFFIGRPHFQIGTAGLMIRSGIDNRAERLPAVGFEVEFDLPAGSRNHRFKAEPADSRCLECCAPTRGGIGATKVGTALLPSVSKSRGSRDGFDIPVASRYTVPPIPSNARRQPVSHTKSEKEKLLARVRRVRGQVEAVERALETEKGCAAVLHLIVAARGAMSSLMTEVIEDHIRLHIVVPTKGAERVRGADELIEAVQAYLK